MTLFPRQYKLIKKPKQPLCLENLGIPNIHKICSLNDDVNYANMGALNNYACRKIYIKCI